MPFNINYIKKKLECPDNEVFTNRKFIYLDIKFSSKDIVILRNFIEKKNRIFLDMNCPNEDKVVIKDSNLMNWLKRARNFKK